MKLSEKLSLIAAVLEAKLFSKRIPLLVGWEITERCNARCRYCNIWNRVSHEMRTEQVFSIINDLSKLGTRIIQFTGGEPLLREDIGMIIEYCRKKNILASMNSNGLLVSARIDDIASLQLLGISLDGPEDVHDYIRGEGSYRGAIQALSAARERGIKLRLLTVLSRHNLHTIDFLLEKAKEFDAPLIFQPATKELLGGDEANPTMPDIRHYRHVVELLIVKKKASKYIVNSISGLKFLYDWPEMRRIRCLARLISCRIQSNGHVYICFRNQNSAGTIEGERQPINNVFLQLPAVYCSQCCCAPAVEINCLLSLKLDSILNSWNLF